MKIKLALTFPQHLIKEPVIFTMAKKFDVMPNIRMAKVSGPVGEMILELEGTEADLDKGLQFLRDQGITVVFIEGEPLE